ncbi:hypothetical protein BH20ACI1_BH20ACI1_26010 [soil metagenome]
MKSILFSFVLIICLCFLTYQGKAQINSDSEKIPKDLSITLEESACVEFNHCPEYKLTIDYTGKVNFEGYKNTFIAGKAEGTISKENIRSIVSAFEKARFFEMQDYYQDEKEDGCKVVGFDMPSWTISIQMNGKTKKVVHYKGCTIGDSLDRFFHLRQTINSLTNSKQWVYDTK